MRDMLKLFADKISKLDQEKFFISCSNELSARLLRKVRKRTTVGVYPKGSGRVGGTLRRNWHVKPCVKVGNEYRSNVSNNTEYAVYVEYGHRTRDLKGFVEGRYMLTESTNELSDQANKIIKNKLGVFLNDKLNNQ